MLLQKRGKPHLNELFANGGDFIVIFFSIFNSYMELFIIFLLTIINGIFSMSEIAVVSSRKVKLENSAKRGSKSAKLALELINSPNQFLSTVQIGITLIGILLGIFGGENLTNDWQDYLNQFEVLKPYSRPLSVGACW